MKGSGIHLAICFSLILSFILFFSPSAFALRPAGLEETSPLIQSEFRQALGLPASGLEEEDDGFFWGFRDFLSRQQTQVRRFHGEELAQKRRFVAETWSGPRLEEVKFPELWELQEAVKQGFSDYASLPHLPSQFLAFLTDFELPSIYAKAASQQYHQAWVATGEAIRWIEVYQQYLYNAVGEPPDLFRLESIYRVTQGEGVAYFKWLENFEVELRGWQERFHRLFVSRRKLPTEEEAREFIQNLETGRPRPREYVASSMMQWDFSSTPFYGGAVIQALVRFLADDELDLQLRASDVVRYFADTLPKGPLLQELILQVLVICLKYGDFTSSGRLNLPVVFRVFDEFYKRGYYTDQLYHLVEEPLDSRGLRRYRPTQKEPWLEQETLVRKVNYFVVPVEVAQYTAFLQSGFWEDIPARPMGDLLAYFEAVGQLPPEEIPRPGPLSQELGFSLKLWKALQEGTVRLKVNDRPWISLHVLFPLGARVALELSTAEKTPPTLTGLEEAGWQERRRIEAFRLGGV